MLPLHAQISTESLDGDVRGASRRTLRLEVPALLGGNSAQALIHNLSEKGLLLETSAPLTVGESLDVDLPEAGLTAAQVIWVRDRLVGCEFAQPVSRGAVSAALLLNPIDRVEETSPSVLPATQSDQRASDFEFDQAVSRVVVITSLLMALAAVILFLFALLSFPFSA